MTIKMNSELSESREHLYMAAARRFSKKALFVRLDVAKVNS